jgi:16S rRNA G966 N2-methylase RsmD
MDPWVVKKCLDPNITSTGFADQAIVHTSKAEDFLSRAQKAKNFVGGAFDFISITPPYMLVSYPQIFDLLEGSPVIGESTIVMIEYSKQNRQDIRETIGPLSLVKDRKYGRTLMAIYANTDV